MRKAPMVATVQLAVEEERVERASVTFYLDSLIVFSVRNTELLVDLHSGVRKIDARELSHEARMAVFAKLEAGLSRHACALIGSGDVQHLVNVCHVGDVWTEGRKCCITMCNGNRLEFVTSDLAEIQALRDCLTNAKWICARL
jgi:hypothetical protein